MSTSHVAKSGRNSYHLNGSDTTYQQRTTNTGPVGPQSEVTKVMRCPIYVAAAWLVALAALAEAAEHVQKRTARAARLQGQLVLDGSPDEPAWQDASVNTGFMRPLSRAMSGALASGKPVPHEAQTEFRVLYDDTTLYIGLVCHEPHPEQIKIKATEPHDDALWADDDIELFIDPTGVRDTYYQFAVNAKAMKTDLYLIEKGNTGLGGWSTVWTAKTWIGADRWTAEIAIPFAAFHLAPIATDRPWAFQVCRTRKPKPAYYSVWSPASGYHKIDEIGHLAGLELSKHVLPMLGEKPELQLDPVGKGYAVNAALWLENMSSRPFDGTVTLRIDTPGAAHGIASVKLGPGERRQVALAGATVPQAGKYTHYFTARERGASADCFTRRYLGRFRYETFQLRITSPHYRDIIYATQQVDAIAGHVDLALPREKLDRMWLEVTLTSPSGRERQQVTRPIADRHVAFCFPVWDAAIGEYPLSVRLLTRQGRKDAAVASKTRVIRRLGRATGVEVRVDKGGNLCVNGVPLFVRGWYGSQRYMISSSSFTYAQLPRSINFMMGGSQEQALRQGFYTLYGLSRTVPDSRRDEPLAEDVKLKVRAAIERVRHDSHIVGYYLSDEPECRGVSVEYLKSAYEFIKELDPYRFVLIVSRAPAQYVEACDVICPHPYLSPRVDKGVRKFGNPMTKLITVTREAVTAARGRKAAWIMPQTFRYRGADHPTFRESRWFTMAGVANGVKGVVPFIFNGYWNHLESRIAMTYVFEELAFLEAPWIASDSDVPIEVTSEVPVSAVAKLYGPPKRRVKHLYIVAANETRTPTKATFNVPAVAKARLKDRLVVLRENRLVKIEGSTFTDSFGPLGVHVYTTNDRLPSLKSLTSIEAEIAAALARGRRQGDLLGNASVTWRVSQGLETVLDNDDEIHGNLIDGVLDSAGWFPVYGSRAGLTIAFDKPVSFQRVWLYSPNLRGLELKASLDGATWQVVHTWRDQSLPELTWQGEPVATRFLQFVPKQTRNGFGSWSVPEITELALYR